MSLSDKELKPVTLKQGILLILLFPLTLILLLEGCAQAIFFLGFSPKNSEQPTQLEMPTWMLQDANALARKKPGAAALEWLSLFVAGDTFRVHLLPNTSRDVRNTFSLIPYDSERTYRITSNSLGFRGPELPQEKAPNSFRIAVFGDSSSFGWGVNYEQSWGALLADSLQERFTEKRIELANFAIPGDSSAYGGLVFQKFGPLSNADLFILGFGANDAKPVIASHTEQVERFRKRSRLVGISNTLKRSALVRIFDSALARITKTSMQSEQRSRVPAVTIMDYGKNLQSMAQQARELGARNTLLLSLCTPSNYAKQARGVARQQQLLWLNGQAQLLKALPEISSGRIYTSYVHDMHTNYGNDLARNKLFYITSDGCHPNELGHRFIADKLTALIAPLLLADSP